MSEAAQFDWVGFEDEGAQLDHLVRAAVQRLSVELVARHLEETPSALRNQVAGRRKLPEGTWSICWRLDAQFRADCAALKKEVLSRPPDLSPSDALREAVVKANARGYIDAAELAAIYARTKKEEP